MTTHVTAQDNAGAIATVTFPNAPGVGNTLLIDVYVNLAPGNVTLPAGWVLKKEGACGAAAGNGSVSTWAKVAGAAEPSTVALTTAASVIRWATSEYSGLATTSADDGTPNALNSGSTAVNTQTPGSLTTTNADDLVHTAFAFAGNITGGSASANSSFTVIQNGTRLVTADRIVSATGSFNPTLTWTTPQRAGGIITAFKAAGSTPGAGTAAGTWAWAGAAAGKRTPKAAGSGVWTWAGTATGTRTPNATSAGVWAWTGTGIGARAPKATASGTWAWNGLPAGTRTPKGTASGTWAWAGAATGARSPKAVAGGTFAWAGAAAGVAPVVAPAAGAAMGSAAWTGVGVGKRSPTSTAAGAWSWTGAAGGARVAKATATGSWVWTDTASGTRTPKAAGTGHLAWGSLAGGVALHAGVAAGLTAWAGAAVGNNIAPRDITVTATLAPRLWRAVLVSPPRTATLSARPWKATL